MTVSANNGFFIPKSRLDFIESLIEQTTQSCMLAIDGTTGVGKTTVLEELLTACLPEANKCYLTAAASLNEIQIRSRIIEQLFGNVLYDPEKSLLNTFLEFNHQTPLLVAIDNGHFLPGQIIGELLQVVAELKKRGYHMVVLVTFDKAQSKTLASIDSALISHYTVPTLSYNESYQLLTRYFDDVPSSNNVKVKRWIESANGIPIQLLAYDQANQSTLGQIPPLNLKLWGAVLVVVSLLFALSNYFYRTSNTDPDSGPTAITELVNKAKDSVTAKTWSKPEVQKQIELQPKKVNVASAADIFDVIYGAEQNQLTAEQAEMTPIEAETPTFAEKKGQEVTITGESLEEIEQKAFDESVVETKEQSSSTDVEEVPVQDIGPEPEVKDTSVQNIIPSVAGYNIDNQALMALPSDKYVLQLTAVSTESILEQYLNSKRLDAELTRIYKIKRNNSDWWVVTYGVFDSISAARETAKTVDNNAWAKSVSVIQQQIAVYQQTLSQ